MFPGLSRNVLLCHMWVEFVVGPRLAPRGFSPGFPVVLHPQKHSKFQFDQDREPAWKPDAKVAKADVASSLNVAEKS